jgi:hypothetical protein
MTLWIGRLMRHLQGLFDPTLTDPLEQLRLALHDSWCSQPIIRSWSR